MNRKDMSLEAARKELIEQVSKDSIIDADRMVELLKIVDIEAESGQMFNNSTLRFCVVIPHTDFNKLEKLIYTNLKKEN